MKKKLLIALLAGTMTVTAPVSCFAAEATDAAEVTQDTAEAETEKEEKTADQKKEELKTVGEKKDGCITFKMKNATSKKITAAEAAASQPTESYDSSNDYSYDYSYDYDDSGYDYDDGGYDYDDGDDGGDGCLDNGLLN